jgi:hypothetical protein
MIIKKISFILLTVIVAAFAAVSCNIAADDADPKADVVTEEMINITLDIDVLAEELFSRIEYDDTLEKVEDFVVDMLYNCSENVTASAGYCASGGTAEAVAVFECETAENADAVIEKLNVYKASMAEDFTRYTPGEVEKLNGAKIVQVGRYVIFSVSPNPDKAADIINEHIEQLLNK